MVISLITLPGNGQRDVTVSAGTTLAEFVNDNRLSGFRMIVQGTEVWPKDFATTILSSGDEVAAIGSSQGN